MSVQQTAVRGLIHDLTEAHESELFVTIDGCYVPPATLERLVNPEAPGDRHNAAKIIVASLACQRLRPRSIYRVLVAAYPDNDFRDDIDGLVDWVCERGPFGDPSKLPRAALNNVERIIEFETDDYPEISGLNHGGGTNATFGSRRGARGMATLKKKASPAAAERAVLTLHGGSLPDVQPRDFIAASPCSLDLDWRKRLSQFFTALFPVSAARGGGPETSPAINIVFRAYKSKEGKVAPHGGGWTFPACKWSKLQNCRDWSEFSKREYGALFRINPVRGANGRGSGSGTNGAYTDADMEVRQRMYVLIECDDLSMQVQLAFWWQHRDYAASLISSGGKSLHALLWVNGYSHEDYRRSARALTNYFRPFGFDATDNASRLSRLPGVERTVKANAEDPYALTGQQQLLWLNPDALPAYKLISKQENASSTR